MTAIPKLCDQTGCPNPATRSVLTNYGFLGNVCDEHYAALDAAYGEDDPGPRPGDNTVLGL